MPTPRRKREIEKINLDELANSGALQGMLSFLDLPTGSRAHMAAIIRDQGSQPTDELIDELLEACIEILCRDAPGGNRPLTMKIFPERF
jgi:hypothetical protein